MDSGQFELLKRHPLFKGLGPDDLKSLLEGASLRVYPKGHLIFQRGDPAESFFVIVRGWVKVYRVTENGEETVIGLFTRGESFAEAAVFMGAAYPASAQVVEESELLRIRYGPFTARLREKPELALNMLATTSRHLHQLVEQFEQYHVRSGTERVADFLLRLCRGGQGAVVISLPYDKSLIASRLGMKPESFSRALAKLRGVGVNTRRDEISIDSVERLARFCGLDDG